MAEAAAGPGHPAGAVAAILEDALDTLGPGVRSDLGQIGRLPLLDAEVVDAVSGDPLATEGRLFERALKAGIPFTPAQAPWWDLAGPVRDYLAALAPVRIDAMSRAAEVYRSRGELGPAFELLLASGDANQAAAVLGATSAPKKTRWTTSNFRPGSTSCPPRRSTLTPRSSSWPAAVSAIRASTTSVASS